MSGPHVHTVLLVDDDDDVRGALALGLSLGKVAVHDAASAREAVALVDRGVRPCLVLLDLRMPDVDGWEALRLLRMLPGMATVPVVFVSGEPPDYARATDAGARAYLRKPVTHELLLASVHRHCAGGTQ